MESYDSVRPNACNSSSERNVSARQAAKDKTKSQAAQRTASRYLKASRAEREASEKAEFLAIMNEHRAVREMVRSAQEHEKNLLRNQWMLEARKAKRKRLSQFLERLSTAKQSSNAPKVKREEKEVRVVRPSEGRKAKAEALINVHVEKKRRLQESAVARSTENYARKMERLEKLQSDKQVFLERKVKARRENREMRVLRAKVRSIIELALSMTCKKYAQGGFGLEADEYPSIDEFFLEAFNENELKQVLLEIMSRLWRIGTTSFRLRRTERE